MEFQKIKNLLDNTPNEPNKFRTKSWVKIDDEWLGTYHIIQNNFLIKNTKISWWTFQIIWKLMKLRKN